MGKCFSREIGDEDVYGDTSFVHPTPETSREQDLRQESMSPTRLDFTSEVMLISSQDIDLSADSAIGEPVGEVRAPASTISTASPTETARGEPFTHPSAPDFPQEERSYEEETILESEASQRYPSSGVIQQIERILENVQAGHFIIMPHPDDGDELHVLGVDVERAVSDFEALRSDTDYSRYCIIPHNVGVFYNGLPLYVTHLTTFKLEKTVEVDDTGSSRRTTNHPICELLVKGDPVNQIQKGNSHQERLYGVTVAHAFLSDWQTKRLFDSDASEELIQFELLEDSFNSCWHLRAENMREPLKITRAPNTRYQHYYGNENEFIQDLAVFGLSNGQAHNQGWRQRQPNAGDEKLLSVTLGSDTYQVAGILPIMNQNHILRLFGKKILVAFTEGTITLSPILARPRGITPGKCLGLGLCFRTSSGHRLEEGYSGSMVYVVDKLAKYRVYIAGMLTGYYDSFEEATGVRIYQSIALAPCLAKLESKFPTKLQHIQLLDNVLENRTMEDVVGQLEEGAIYLNSRTNRRPADVGADAPRTPVPYSVSSGR